MRCRKHHTDLSSSVGVCASCLRERLFTLIAAQAQLRSRVDGNLAADDPIPPPIVFPRSVSPYVSRRKSDESACSDLSRGGNRRSDKDYHRRFHSTPQIGPTYMSSSATSTFVTSGSFGTKKKSRFSIFSSLFRSRSEKFEKNREIHSRESCTSSPSWFSMLLTNRRNKQSAGDAEQRQCHGVDRGMSPARISDAEEECGGFDRSPTALGHLSDLSPKLQQSPMTAPGSAKRGKASHKRNVSGFAFCLSPLVRASPNRNWSLKGLPPEIAFSGDPRVATKPHLCANRSRKIADFGRVNHNR